MLNFQSRRQVKNMTTLTKKNILIIEDDISLSDNLSMFLSKKNFNILLSQTGKEALHMCLKHPPDLIISDIALPDMSGFSVIKVLKMNAPTRSIPFIFLSAQVDSADIQTGLELGAKDYITKPFKVKSLLEVIYSSIALSDEEKETILVIEDDPDTRDNLHSIFKRNGYNVVIASNGKDGIEKAFSNSLDLIVCDIMLSDLEGYSVLEKLALSDSTRTIPFVFLSTNSDSSHIRKGVSIGVDDYITIPFNADDLLNSVKKKIDELKNFENLSESSGSFFAEQPVIKENDQITEENLRKVSTTRDLDFENSNIFEDKNILELEKKEEPILPQIFNEDVHNPSGELIPLGYDDEAFEYFLTHRTISLDYESYFYKNVLVIIANLHMAVQREAILFYNYLQNVIETGYMNIVLDMSKVDFFDSTYTGVLISCKRLISMKGGKIKLVTKKNQQFSNPMIQQSFENNFEIYKDLKPAILSCGIPLLDSGSYNNPSVGQGEVCYAQIQQQYA